MGNILVAINTAIYFCASIAYAMDGRYGLAWMFAGYALANGGVIAIGMGWLK